MKDLVAQYVRKTDHILMLGCGNSRLSEDMYDDGFTTVSNIDISKVCIDQMVEKYRDKTGLTWQQMNCSALEFPDESFDVVLDKGNTLREEVVRHALWHLNCTIRLMQRISQ